MSNVIEMNHITKKFGDFKALDDVTLHIEKGEIHALLGENGAGKSTLMSVLFGLYQPEEGEIYINGKKEDINNPNIANDLGIGMVHQHFKLVHNFTVLENIVLGHETVNAGFLKMTEARKKVVELSENYKFNINPDAYISDITVGMQQKVEILKMLYCDNDILIFDEPTAVLTPQEIDELMEIMKQMAKEGKSIVFITHKLNEIKAVADRCSVLRKGKYIGTVDVKSTSKEEMSEMMVGRKVNLNVDKKEQQAGDTVLEVKNLTIKDQIHSGKNAVSNVSFTARKGEIVTIAGIDGNGQSELVYGITGLLHVDSGQVIFNGKDITNESIRKRCLEGMAHIPEDRHKFGLVLDYTLAQNLVLQTYYDDRFQKNGFIKFEEISKYAKKLIEQYDVRSGQGEESIVRGMSGGNQQKAIIARELDRDPDVVIAVQPVRGLDVGAIEYIHKKLVEQRDKGKVVLLVSFELDEVMNLSDRILVMYEGEIVADIDPKTTTTQELGLYMAGTKRGIGYEKQ
ncbi:ABC transporter, ATP-binding protein [Peptoanaerobacter stomatis]|uniref:ABC transporter, ATP-binding protein n=1 Tax=Peptoanaerobacter stomatis TaxID=796937 RepID=J4WFY2_9FIRM|nr:ABC transporter ATP-binding protein [Peptoanaerobacter stomatis]EJU24136.1 ABC transporter, ATP-binding protein [Peptoanaerobacter stomatis]NWO24182.1 ABC transporter ATP-binding protein [Peptostreptococcaceae bacterium oral taxon 081]